MLTKSLKSTCSLAAKTVFLKQKQLAPFRALQTVAKSETKKSYVVLAYVDYRKEHGSVPIRTYLDRQKAIDFAESLSTKYVDPNAKNKQEEEVDEGAQDASIVGTEFDAMMKFPKERLVEFGVREQDVRNLWYTRIAVSVAEHID